MGSRKSLPPRPGRSGLTREMLLPLPTEKVRALSLENHLALATVRGGRGDLDQVSCLVRVVYLAFYLRDATSAGADFDLFRRAEAARHNNGGKGTDVTNAPPSAAFPISYDENFDSYAVNDYKVGYFAPLQGAYRVDNCTGGRTGKCLVQAAAPNPIPWSNNVNWDPFALVGNRKWTDQTISADIKLPDSDVSTYGAIGGHGQNSRLKSAYGYGGYKGYELRIIGNGQWELAYYAAAETRTSVATGALGSAATNWHSAKLIFSQDQVSAVVDGAVVVPPRAVATGLTSGMGAILSSPSPIQYDNFAITSTSPAG